MQNENLFEKITELKIKFAHFLQQRKKINALENYSSAVKFYHKNYLKLIKVCMDEGFLGEEEALFLEFIVKRYEINYLDWCHRTKWVKDRLRVKKAKSKMVPIQMLIDFEKKHQSVEVPFSLIASQKVHQVSARAL